MAAAHRDERGSETPTSRDEQGAAVPAPASRDAAGTRSPGIPLPVPLQARVGESLSREPSPRGGWASSSPGSRAGRGGPLRRAVRPPRGTWERRLAQGRASSAAGAGLPARSGKPSCWESPPPAPRSEQGDVRIPSPRHFGGLSAYSSS